MNFKIKHQNKINSLEPGNTSNYLNGGDPPQKKGTATTVTSEDKKNLLAELYQSAKASYMASKGPDPEGKKKMLEYAEALKRQDGGIQKWQEMTGAVMKKKGEVEGTYEDVTLSEYAKDKGVPETEAAGDLRRQAIKVSKSKKKQD